MFFKTYVIEKFKKKNIIAFHIQLKKVDHVIIKKRTLFYLWIFAYKCLAVYIKIKITKHINKMKKTYLIQKQSFYDKTFVLIFKTLILKNDWYENLCSNFFFHFLNYSKANTNYLILSQLHSFRKKKKENRHNLNSLLGETEQLFDCFKNNEFKKLKSIKHNLFYKDYKYLNSYIKKKITNVNNFLNYKLLEQNGSIEHIHDYFIYAKTVSDVIDCKKLRKNKYRYTRIKSVILVYWICLIIIMMFPKKTRLTLT